MAKTNPQAMFGTVRSSRQPITGEQSARHLAQRKSAPSLMAAERRIEENSMLATLTRALMSQMGYTRHEADALLERLNRGE